MKNKRIRLVAVLLTLAMAMAFSGCAKQTTVADENEWAFGQVTGDLNGTCYEWCAEAFMRDTVIAEWDKAGTTWTEKDLKVGMEAAKDSLQEQGCTIRDETLLSDAYLGYSQEEDGSIYWYTKTDYENMKDCYFEVDWSTGTLTYITATGAEQEVKAIN